MGLGSAYVFSTLCITPYKQPYAAIHENKTFNYHVSPGKSAIPSFWPGTYPSICTGACEVRTCNGLYKRSVLLTLGFQQQNDNICDHGQALVWVKTCIVFHALISIIEEEDEDMEYIAELVQEGRDCEELH
jgi:hypothetical protein